MSTAAVALFSQVAIGLFLFRAGLRLIMRSVSDEFEDIDSDHVAATFYYFCGMALYSMGAAIILLACLDGPPYSPYTG